MEQQYNTSPEALEQIRQFEGLRLTAYKCPGGTWTIGYGHTGNTKQGDRISEWYADYLFQQDIALCEAAVNALHVCKTQGQFDALVDFVFNLGIKQFQESTLLKYIQRGASDDEITDQFMRWCYSKKKRLKGLEKRCEWRALRWLS